METNKIDKLIKYNGKYRDIYFEIHNFTRNDGPKWTYYLYIKLEQMPEEIRERFWLSPDKSDKVFKGVYYSYHRETLITDLEWHYGCTWYSKVRGFDGEPRVVKIGCDYNHLWDEGRSYDMEYVARDARRCIDSLHDRIPHIKRWCPFCGAYFVPSGDDERKCPKCSATPAPGDH